MDDYNRYVTAVNKIFDYLEKMKAGWNNLDNKNYIDSIDEFKGVVTSRANEFKNPPTVKLEKTSAEIEEEQEKAFEEEQEARKQAQQVGEELEPERLPEEEQPLEEIPMKEIPASFDTSLPEVPSVEALGE
ncbi:MAG: hypothetical protein IKF71_02545 [Bacilli bacterium]|nr:hypothetical protein [Bacilli bacterium]